MIDLKALDSSTVRSLSNLREPGTDRILKLWASELEATKQKLVHAGDTALIHRLQGRAELLEDLLRAHEEASEVVKRT